MAITPFKIDVPQKVLTDLAGRLANTAWPEDLENEDWGYGVNGAYLHELVTYWRDDYDWRAAENRINGFSHFRTIVDGVPIHFIREPGRGPKPIPLILTHGWPWTFWDMQHIIRPLADPGAFGGDPADAFDVIVPSLPGFGFSTPLPPGGMNFWKTADLWRTFMVEHLGYRRFAAAGGDWGVLVNQQLGHKYPDDLFGIHITQTIGFDNFNRERFWDMSSGRVPETLPDADRKALLKFWQSKVSHVTAHTLDAQTLAFALHDSPVGLLAWLLKRRRDWGDTHGDVESMFPREHLITTTMLYWVTRSFVSSARYYADAVKYPWRPSHDRTPLIQAPTGITFLSGEFPPGSTLETRVAAFEASPLASMYNRHYLKAHQGGGHFSHYENPNACIEDIRATFRSLR